MPLENLDDLNAAWSVFLEERNAAGKLTQGAAWRRDNPGEWSALSAYHAGTGPRPTTLKSQTGRQMLEVVDALIEARGTTPDPDPDPGPDPTPGKYGSGLPVTPVTRPDDTPAKVSTLTQLRNAIASSASIIQLTAVIAGSGEVRVERGGVWFEGVNGGGTKGMRWLLIGGGVRKVAVTRLYIEGGGEGVKVEGGGGLGSPTDVLIADNRLVENVGMGISQQGPEGETGSVRNLHVIRNHVLRPGLTIPSGHANQHHGLYLANLDGGLVAANRFEGCQAFGSQIYPASRNVISTCNDYLGGVARGGIYVGDGSTSDITFVGELVKDSPSQGVEGGAARTTMFDSLVLRAGDVAFGAGIRYVRCATTGNPVGYIDPARYALVPPYRLDGSARVTADAGA